MSLEFWKNINPLLVSIPLKETKEIPYGVIYSKNPNKNLKKFIKLIDENK